VIRRFLLAGSGCGLPSPDFAPSAARIASRSQAPFPSHPLSRALLVLTFSTGVIDAVRYLGLGQVFTANMTGNIVLLGFGIAGRGNLPVLAHLISLVAFLAGAAGVGVLASRLAERHSHHVARALAIEVSLFGAAAVVAAVIDVRPDTGSGDAVIVLLSVGMGVRNATVGRIAVPDLTTTMLTLAVTGLAADARISGGSGKGAVRRTTGVLAMICGAVAGAVLTKTSLVVPLALSSVLALLTWLIYVPPAQRAQPAAGPSHPHAPLLNNP
jgi:uncharacterized membrane protein YoaK (UPF0700 family)